MLACVMLREQCLLLHSPGPQPGKGAVGFQAWSFPYELTIKMTSPQSCPQTNTVSMISVKLAAPGLLEPGTMQVTTLWSQQSGPGVSLESRLVFGVVKVES